MTLSPLRSAGSHRPGRPHGAGLSPRVRRLALLLAGAASAAAAPTSATAAERPLWELGLGVAGLQMPHYRGSAQSHAWLLPAPYLVYRGKILRADREGLRARLFDTDRVDIELSLAGSAPTRSDDSDARRGMADLKPTFEIGPQARFTLWREPGWKLDLRVPVRTAVTIERNPHTVGWLATPNLNVDFTGFGGWNLGALVGPIYGTRRQHAYFYDVTPADATAQRPAYRAPGGYAGMRGLVAVSRRFPGTWVGAFLRYDDLGGARFADSPLVTQRRQWSGGIAVSWIFATSSERVESPE
jgi:outer membrane scaffolding protein for murein synthesis (MipA/OmpV family)